MKPNKLWLLLVALALMLPLIACASEPLPAETPAPTTPAPLPTPAPPEEAIPLFPEEVTKVGLLEQNETWSGEIFIPGAVHVPQGVTLTIEPGTVVKFRHSRDYKNLGRGESVAQLVHRTLHILQASIFL